MGIFGQSLWFSTILCLIFPSWFNVSKNSNKFSNQKLYLIGWWGGTISLFGFIIHSLTATGNATFFEIGWSMSLILALSLWWIVWKKMDTKLSKLMDTLSKTTEYESTKERVELEKICFNLQKVSTNIVKVCLALWIVQISFITATFS